MDNPFISTQKSKDSPWRICTIETVEAGGATVKFDGEDTATNKVYKCLGSYTPAADDRVLMAWFSGTGVILGKY